MNTKQNFRLWKDLYEAELSGSESAISTATHKHAFAFGRGQSLTDANTRREWIIDGLAVNREAQIKERLRRINKQLGIAA